LHVTIALNVEREKPQLSPWGASVFSKKADAIYNSRADARVSQRGATEMAGLRKFVLGLF